MGAVTVREITMAAPDIIRLEIWDEEVERGPLVLHGGDESAATQGNTSGTTFYARTNPISGLSDYAAVSGPNKEYWKFQDQTPTNYLNPTTADDYTQYSISGTVRTVTAVYRKSMANTSGYSATTAWATLSMRHYVYLVLDAALAEGGPYTISITGNTFPATAFTYSYKTTRCCAIRSTQVGHRRSDADKSAILSLWVPGAIGTGGAIDYATTYSVSQFNILDAFGATVFTGSVAERASPTTAETYFSYRGVQNEAMASAGLMISADLSQAPLNIASISQANPAEVGTVEDHGLATDAVVMLYDVDNGTGYSTRGMGPLNFNIFKITSTGLKTFTLREGYVSGSSYLLRDKDTTGYVSFKGGGGKVYKTRESNSAGTWTFVCDFSAADLPAGTYYVQIPGLGVSDPIVIREDAWHLVAKNLAAGAYHQMTGIAIDGRFGWERPVSLKDGTNSVEVYQSWLPNIFATAVGLVGSYEVANGAAAYSPWITSTRVTYSHRAFQDAADNNEDLKTHGWISYMYLDLFERLFAENGHCTTNFGIPKMSEIWGDTTEWDDANALDDVFHLGAWGLEGYARHQGVDGRVPGGWDCAPNNTSVDCNQLFFEPLYITRGKPFAYAPDHFSNFIFAGCAAKLAKILHMRGRTTLSATWRLRAELAWDWAWAIFNDAAGEYDAYYDTEMAVKTKASWDQTTYDSVKSTVQTRCQDRGVIAFAAACLFALRKELGEDASAYDSAYLSYTSGAFQSDYIGCGSWEYINAPGANAAHKTGRTATLIGYADACIALYASNDPYKNVKYGTNEMYGYGGTSLDFVSPMLIWGHLLTGDTKYIKPLQAGLCYIHGANALGMCLVSGIGQRNVRGQLHNETRYGGQETPAGIPTYGTVFPGGLLAFQNFGVGTQNAICLNPDPVTFPTNKEIERTPAALPGWPNKETLFEHPLVINMMEYTITQNIAGQGWAAIYLHGWDGNAVTAIPTTYIQRTVSCVVA